MKVFERCMAPKPLTWDSKSPMKADSLVVRPGLVYRADEAMFVMQLELEWPNIVQRVQRCNVPADAWFTYDDFIRPDTLYPLRLDPVVEMRPATVVSRIATEELWKTCTVEVLLEGDRGTATVMFRGRSYTTKLPTILVTDLRESGTIRPNDK